MFEQNAVQMSAPDSVCHPTRKLGLSLYAAAHEPNAVEWIALSCGNGNA